MASYTPGYDEERFANSVNRNFLCLICFNVLRDPVRCPRNQHIFCRGCITKYLENSQRCPTCSDPLTVETLAGAPPMVKDMLNELNIHCEHVNRGCHEIVQLEHLDRHEATCGFQPVVCTNQGCGVTVSRRDLIHHESEICEFRKLKCHSCGEMSKTLEVMEKKITKVEMRMETNVETKIGNLERKMGNLERNMDTKMGNLEKNMDTKMGNMEMKMGNLEKNMADMKTDMEGKFEAANNEVRGLKAALIKGFDQMKEVLVKMENMKEENTKELRSRASGDKENIIVAGGAETDSVEMFNWRLKLWSPLQSMPEKRYGASSFVYNNHVTVAGGFYRGSVVNSMIRMNINPSPDLSAHWSECPVKLGARLGYHSSVLYDDQLLITGGCEDYLGTGSDCIDEVQLVPPYAERTLSRMPQPRRDHGTEIFYDNVLIVGGSPYAFFCGNLKSVVVYDIKKNECKQLASLPYEVSSMATVRWGDNIVLIGGLDKDGKALDTVVIYNVKTEQSHMLPPMICKRWACAAVVVGNNIVVLGGIGEHARHLKSVEAFNFDSYTWQELPEMSETRCYHTAVVV